MGLDDRHYMGNSSQRTHSPSSITNSLTLSITVIVACVYLSKGSLYEVLKFSTASISSGEIWRLTTSIFVLNSENFVGLIFSLYIFYIFSRDVERYTNWKTLALIYSSSALCASLVGYLLLAPIAPNFIGGLFGCLLCSAVMGYALVHASNELSLMLFFVIPVRLKGQTIAFIMVGGLLLMLLFGDVSSLFSLLSIGVTYIYLKKLYPSLQFDFGLINSRFLNKKKAAKRKAHKHRMNLLQKNFHLVKEEDESLEDFISSKIDPVLEKIAKDGLSSLSKEERELLDKAREDLKKK